MVRVAINGLGRIGRATLKIAMETPGLDLVAANDLGAPDNLVYLLKYDTVYGRYDKAVAAADGHLRVGEHKLRLLAERDPMRLPWKSLSVDIVFECTGAFTRREDLVTHVSAGARYVILSAPSKSDDVETIVHGVNTPKGDTTVISCASCTTNCIAPVMEILDRRIGVKKAIMTTVHAYTSSQAIVDYLHKRTTEAGQVRRILYPRPPARRQRRRKRCRSTTVASMAWPSVLQSVLGRSQISSPSVQGPLRSKTSTAYSRRKPRATGIVAFWA